MVAAIFAAAQAAEIKVPGVAFILAQGTVGAMVARVLKPSILTEIRSDWLLFFVAVFAVIAASVALGWLLASAARPAWLDRVVGLVSRARRR